MIKKGYPQRKGLEQRKKCNHVRPTEVQSAVTKNYIPHGQRRSKRLRNKQSRLSSRPDEEGSLSGTNKNKAGRN